MESFNDNSKLKDVISAAKRDPDKVTVFGFGGGLKSMEGAIVIIKGAELAQDIIKWFENQGLTTDRPIPKQ